MISHELRTPLHAIVSSVELLELNLHSESDRKIIQRLETGARHLEAQMRDLTDFARLGAGKLELRLTVFDPHANCSTPSSTPIRRRQTLKDLYCAAQFVGERGTDRIGPAPAAPDRDQPRHERDQIHGRRFASMFVSNARWNGSTYRVIDTGPGIAREQLPLIFKEFTQLDSSTTRRFDGAGMGLAVVRGLVELLGGVVERVERCRAGLGVSRELARRTGVGARPSASRAPADLPAVG